MNFFERSKGAISIFLVIILVPMLTVSSLFVDISRVELARSVAASAGDLTMNTALTNYDTMLKDLYGLFATAQDKEDLFGKLEDYYRTCIVSAGIGNQDADTYVDQIISSLKGVSDSSSADLLKMELVDFSTKPIDGANLANATIMKSQIVNFMKYRAPIDTGLSFISSLKSFTTLSSQTKLVDCRTEYYEEQQGVMEDCKKTWDEIAKYNNNEMAKGAEKYFENLRSDLTSFETNYNAIAKKIIMDLYDTQSFVSIPVSDTDVNNALNSSGSGTYTTSQKDSAKQSCDSAYSEVAKSLAELEAFYNYSGPSSDYGLQYLVQVNRKSLLKNYENAVKKYYASYKIATYAMQNPHMNPPPDDSEEGTPDTPDFTPESTKSYDDNKAAVAKKFSEIYGKFKTLSDSVTKESNYSETDKKLKEMNSKFIAYKDTLTSAKSFIDAAIESLTDVLDAVKPGGDLDDKKNDWSEATKQEGLEGSSMAKQDTAEIRDLSTYLKESAVSALKERLEKISTSLGDILSEMEKYELYGKKLYEIKDYNYLKKLMGDVIGDTNLKAVPIKKSLMDQKVNEWTLGKFVKGDIKGSWTDYLKNFANLHEQDKLNFYVFLFTHFGSSATTSKDKSGDADKVESIKDSAADEANKQVESAEKGNSISPENTDIAGKDNLPSTEAGRTEVTPSNPTGGAIEETSVSLSGMFAALGSKLKDLAVDLRDDIYISEYVMGMFSYDTIENECKKKLEKNKQTVPNPLVLSTLTKNPISKENNFAYGREVEYIIYGGSNTGNVVKAYASIFGIRLAFNLVYAFTDSSIRDGAFAVATPISAATLGIVPVPLIQAAIIIGLALAESGLDINDLRNGDTVPLFKNKKSWRMSFEGLMNTLVSQGKVLAGEALEYGIDETANKLNEFLDATDEELTSMGEQKIAELTSSVAISFDSMVGRHAEGAIQKLTTLANNAIEDAKLKTKTDDTSVDEMVKHIEKGLNDWLAEEAKAGTNDLAYAAKEAAVMALTEDNGGLISDYIFVLKDALGKPEAAVKDVADSLQKTIVEIRKEINNTISNATGKIAAYKTDLINSAKKSISEGAESLKKTITEKLGGSVAGPGKKDETGLASLLSFRYSDYMQLFLVIGLLVNQEAVLLRTADVVQCNMQLLKNDYADFNMKNSVVYVETTATVQVKPLLLALPLFEGVDKNPKDNTNWYIIKYKGIKGY